MNTCQICHQNRQPALNLRIPDEDESDGFYTTEVCSSCWDIIATLASKTLDHRLTAIENALHTRAIQLDLLADLAGDFPAGIDSNALTAARAYLARNPTP